MWVVAELDDDYITKMEDVLEIYERPYDQQQPVVCLDEKPITLHADVRPASPAAPGREARRDNEYERCGTANVFCAVEPKAGRHFTFATPDRSGFEFAQVAVTLALAYPEAKTIHLVLDNLNIHRRKALVDVFGAEMATEVWDRFTVHYTPTHGSWLNQAEIEIGMFSRQCLGKRRIPSLKILRAEARAWNRRMNRDRVKIAWKFDRMAARRKFGYKRKSFKRSETYFDMLLLQAQMTRETFLELASEERFEQTQKKRRFSPHNLIMLFKPRRGRKGLGEDWRSAGKLVLSQKLGPAYDDILKFIFFPDVQ